jgi:ComF family protein
MAGLSAIELWDGWLSCLAPARCAGCDGSLAETSAGISEACAPLLDAAPETLRPPSRQAAAFGYGGPLADAIARLKYGGRTDLAPALGALVAEAASAYAGQVDVVIPMPLFARRLYERGFNQSALLGRYAARALGVPLRADVLRRVRDTATQAGLSSEARAANVRGAFRARAICERVLLIDDVRTTGATLASAAEALRAAGAAEVAALALAAAAR